MRKMKREPPHTGKIIKEDYLEPSHAKINSESLCGVGA